MQKLLVLSALALAGSITGGGCRAYYRLVLALHPAPRGWFAVDVRRSTSALGSQPDSTAAYEARFTAVGASEPRCDDAVGPILVLVPGIEGETSVWREALAALADAQPRRVFVYRWLPYERLDVLADEFARGVRALRACAGSQRVLVVGHGEGGLLAALAAPGYDGSPSDGSCVLVTVAAPLAGRGRLEARRDGKPRSSFFLDLEGVISAYPPPARGVQTVVLRTRAPADAAMRPGAGGYEPHARAVVPPGAVTFDLPADIGHDEALLYAAHGLARGRWRDWLAAPEPMDAAGRPARGVCRLRQEILADGDRMIDVLLDRGPGPDTPMWEGATLAAEPPDPRLYVRCRPCGCDPHGTLAPWNDWAEINARAYARLRTARAPYPVAIIPGFHGGGMVARRRLQAGLELLRRGWIAALVLSGGHRRGGHNEAQHFYGLAQRLAAEQGVDVADRLFVEPCAVHTLTNLRNSLRLMAALGLRAGLFVTDTRMTGQAMVLYHELDELVARDLRCELGRAAYLVGDGPLPRMQAEASPCAPPLSWRSNPVTFLLPLSRPAIFWVSPYRRDNGREHSALGCIGGAPRLVANEPDDGDPFASACLPVLGTTGLACEAGEDPMKPRPMASEDD